MDDNGIHSAVNVQTAERIAGAPLPTRTTLRMRQNLLIQSWRFARINLKMIRIIFGGHG
ncbi:MAG: hypothetical protein ABI307_06350 [Mycobacterium sp.]